MSHRSARARTEVPSVCISATAMKEISRVAVIMPRLQPRGRNVEVRRGWRSAGSRSIRSPISSPRPGGDRPVAGGCDLPGFDQGRQHRRAIIDFAARLRLPSVAERREFVDGGALFVHGSVVLTDAHRSPLLPELDPDVQRSVDFNQSRDTTLGRFEQLPNRFVALVVLGCGDDMRAFLDGLLAQSFSVCINRALQARA